MAPQEGFKKSDPSGGTDFLAEWLPGLDNRVPYHVNLSWRLVLFDLAMGHYQRALDLCEADMRLPVIANSADSLNDRASLTWRLRMYWDAALPARWEQVWAQATPNAERSSVP